jgi:3',5'-cyclic AMP phosphodiesterase CpdA
VGSPPAPLSSGDNRFQRARRRYARALQMRASGYRVAPLVVVLALVAAVLAVSGGWSSESDTATGGGPFLPSRTGRATTLWAVGDGADGGAHGAAVARLIARSKARRFLYLGDVYEDGTAAEFARNYDPLYGRFAKQTAPTPGNHDWPRHREGYDPYWKRKGGRPLQHYYSFEAGGWRVISLNSEMAHDSWSPQVRWLRSRVAGRGTCRLAFWHRPRYSAGDNHGDQPDVQPFWEVLKGRAAIVVNGHEHDMQRFKPRDGITEFVSGAGGHGLYGLDASRPGLAYANRDTFGALRLELSPGRARYRFVSAAGGTLDSGSVRCRAG